MVPQFRALKGHSAHWKRPSENSVDVRTFERKALFATTSFKKWGWAYFQGWAYFFGRLQQLLNYSSKDTAITQPIIYHGKKTTAHVDIKCPRCPVVLWSEERGGSCVSM